MCHGPLRSIAFLCPVGGFLGNRVAGRRASSLFDKKRKVVLGAAGCGVRLGLGFCLDSRSGMESPGRARACPGRARRAKKLIGK